MTCANCGHDRDYHFDREGKPHQYGCERERTFRVPSKCGEMVEYDAPCGCGEFVDEDAELVAELVDKAEDLWGVA